MEMKNVAKVKHKRIFMSIFAQRLVLTF